MSLGPAVAIALSLSVPTKAPEDLEVLLGVLAEPPAEEQLFGDVLAGAFDEAGDPTPSRGQAFEPLPFAHGMRHLAGASLALDAERGALLVVDNEHHALRILDARSLTERARVETGQRPEQVVVAPPDNPNLAEPTVEVAALTSLQVHGKRLFESEDVGCSSCHEPSEGFVDGMRHEVGTTSAAEAKLWEEEKGRIVDRMPSSGNLLLGLAVISAGVVPGDALRRGGADHTPWYSRYHVTKRRMPSSMGVVGR